MRAAVLHRYGPPSVLEVSEVGVPLPGRGDVFVHVGAASIHPGDYFVMTGKPYLVRLAFGLRRPRHGTPGMDLAGVQPGQTVLVTGASGGVGSFAVLAEPVARRDLLTLADLLAAGQITPVIDRTYPLEEAADALRYVGAGHTQGKVVITV